MSKVCDQITSKDQYKNQLHIVHIDTFNLDQFLSTKFWKFHDIHFIYVQFISSLVKLDLFLEIIPKVLKIPNIIWGGGGSTNEPTKTPDG